MSDVVIKVENLSKQYRLGTVGIGTLSHDLNRFWAKVRGKEDPYLKIGQANDRTKKGDSDYVWALKDINFEVRRGEVLGIIGRNGAGKSTLLKILSQITRPTTGSVKMKGRVGSLLEVGTGFHPELTGRENIYINGAILGMRKWEIDKKLDEIIDFAGVERYIDTPVKRYSSGMMVRLGFSVAAHLEPEILIVDEVLAVGDAEFQKKCLGKMGEVSKNEGRTILFVSHNLGAVKEICSRGLLVDFGEILQDDTSQKVVEKYNQIKSNEFKHVYRGTEEGPISEVGITDEEGNLASVISANKAFYLLVKINKHFNHQALIGFSICSHSYGAIYSTPIFHLNSKKFHKNLRIKIPNESLKSGDYYLEGAVWSQRGEIFLKEDNFLNIRIEEKTKEEIMGQKIKGLAYFGYPWKEED